VVAAATGGIRLRRSSEDEEDKMVVAKKQVVQLWSNTIGCGLKGEQSSERPLGPTSSIVASFLASFSVAHFSLVEDSVKKNKSCGNRK
jgi:hypothetical protein